MHAEARRAAALFATATFAVAACTDRSAQVAGPERALAPQLAVGTVSPPDRYVVVFRHDLGAPDSLTDRLIQQHGGTVHFRYHYALKGFAATLPPQALQGIRNNPNVVRLEPDGVVHAIGTELNPPSWGLDRIDQHPLPLDQSYTSENQGTRVHVYILDTGIRFTHQEYAGRVQAGPDYVDNDNDPSDCQGHGTHVAGTVGGSTVGVAKNVTLVAVRVLDCSGSGFWSQVIAGIDWVTAQRVKPAVANMSLGGGFYAPLNDAVNNSVKAGVTYAVAAGNRTDDACSYSPASAAWALTVGATESNDARAYFSNYGTCLDLFAPGSEIYSSINYGDNTYASWSGTSMAAPHVAGVAALFLAANPGATPAQVEAALKGGATTGVVTDPGVGSPDLLLYSLIAGGAPPQPPPPTPTIHSGDLDGASWLSGENQWTADVTITVHDAGHNPVVGVTVSGTWSGGWKGKGSCVTDESGRCSMTTASIDGKRTSIRFTLETLSATGLAYDRTGNHDPDGDSQPPGRAITLARP
jgi:subtilisin family serine protease